MDSFNETRLELLLRQWADARSIAACFEALRAAYTQPGRHYHGVWHIEECLALLDEHRILAQDPRALELAIWFHDVVYEPGAKDNERASAAWALPWLERLEMAAGSIEDVCAMIIATERHEPQAADPPDCALMIDIDLTSLAAEPEVFARNTELIRREFQQIDEREFARGRVRFLEAFLARARIYQADVFHERYEARARANLRRSLDKLRAVLQAVGSDG
ncbi:MAG: HD domain-containing protein [Opitutaceae bacterium]